MVKVIQFECPAQNLEASINDILRRHNLTDNDIISLNLFPFWQNVSIMTNTGSPAQKRMRFFYVVLVVRSNSTIRNLIEGR